MSYLDDSSPGALERRRLRWCNLTLRLILNIFLTLAILLPVIYQAVSTSLAKKERSLIAIDAQTGKLGWSVPLNIPVPLDFNDPSNSFAVFTSADGNRVFVGIASQVEGFRGDLEYNRYEIRAFDTATGRKLWSFSPPIPELYRASQMAQLPVQVRGDTLWLNVLLRRDATRAAKKSDLTSSSHKKARTVPLGGVARGQVMAIDATTGRVRWKIDRDWYEEFPRHTGIAVRSDSPKGAARSDRAAILRITPTQEVWLETYQAKTGRKLWQTLVAKPAKWEKKAYIIYLRYNLSANSETVFLQTTTSVSGYDWMTGKLKFNTKIKSESGSEARLFSKIVGKQFVSASTFYSNSYGEIQAFDASTGALRWILDANKALSDGSCDLDPVASVTDGIYVVANCWDSKTDRGSDTLHFLDAKTGSVQWSRPIGNLWDSGLCPNPTSCTMALYDQIATFVRGSEISSWQLEPNLGSGQSMSATGDRVFLLANVPRWQNLESKWGLSWKE